METQTTAPLYDGAFSGKEKPMRRIVKVKLSEEFTIECKELSLGQMFNLSSSILDPSKYPDENLFGYLKSTFSNELIPLTTNLQLSQLADLYLSELTEIWKGIEEANKDFFTLAAKLEIPKILGSALEALLGQVARNLEKTLFHTEMNTGELPVSSLPTDTPTL